MTLATEVKSMYNHTKEVYDSLEALGATMPEDKNLENLATVFDSLPTMPPYDPANPTIDGLKAALDAGDYAAFPVGTEIPDEYDGQSNPLIVAQYLDSSNNSSYGGAEGVILQRKNLSNVGQEWGTIGNNNYGTSSINTFLNTTYLESCSDNLKSMISNIPVPTVISTGQTQITAKWFLPSLEEVYGDPSVQYAPGLNNEGIFFNYWKNKTGLTSPSNSANAGRTFNGTPWLTRTRYSAGTSNIWAVYFNGSLGSNIASGTDCGIIPCCFISKN